MLEDEVDRIERFRSVLRERSASTTLRIERTAPEFIEMYLNCVHTESKPDLVALDHDLFTDNPGDPDPGDGRDVARFLTDCDPICPVLIHSTNAPAADSMLYALLDAGWIADRISPIGTDWIEDYWYPCLKNFADGI